MITYKQLTLAEIFEDCQNKFSNDKCQFLTLFDEAINLEEIFYFCNKKMPYLCGLRRFANA